MSRRWAVVQVICPVRQEAPEVARDDPRLLGPKALELPPGEGATRALARLRLPRPEEPQARVPPALDPADQRRGSAERALVQPVHRRLPEGRDRLGSEGSGGSRRSRSRRFRRDRRAGEVGARELSERGSSQLLRATFEEVPELYERARPLYPAQLFDDLVSLGELRPGSRVVEVGPGTGQASLPLAERGFELVGVELGERLAGFAR